MSDPLPKAALHFGGRLNLSELSNSVLDEEALSGRDTVHEMAQDYNTELWKAVEKNAAVLNQFYIYVTRRSMSGVSRNVIRQLFMGCAVKPHAMPHSDCWYVDVDAHELELVWTLPGKDAIKEIASTKPLELDPFLVRCCEDYVSGKLNREQRAAGANELKQLAREIPGVQLA